MKAFLVVVELEGRASTLEALTSTIFSVVFYRTLQMSPKPERKWWQLQYILKTAHCSVFIREKIPLSALLMSLFCVKIACSC